MSTLLLEPTTAANLSRCDRSGAGGLPLARRVYVDAYVFHRFLDR